jgi:hypothetical protein
MRYAAYYSLYLTDADPFEFHSSLSPSSVYASDGDEIPDSGVALQPLPDIENEYENISAISSVGKSSTSSLPSLRAIIVVLSIPPSISSSIGSLQLKSLQASQAAADAASKAVLKAAKRHQAACGSDLSFAEGRHPLYRSALRAGLKCL